MRVLIQEMEGNPQDLRNPPNARRSEGEGVGEEGQGETGVWVGAPPPLGGRRTPKEQARAIMDWIINLMLGGGPHSGQTSLTQTQRSQRTGGARVQGGQDRRGGGGDKERMGRGRREGEGNSKHPPTPPP